MYITDGCGKEKKGARDAASSPLPDQDALDAPASSKVCANHTLANSLWYAFGAKVYAGEENPKNNKIGETLLKKMRHTVGHFKHSGKSCQELNELQIARMNNGRFDKFPYDRKAGTTKPKRAAAAVEVVDPVDPAPPVAPAPQDEEKES